MYKRNIAVLGANKPINAAVAKKLAAALEMYFLDTDEYIAYEANMPAAHIISDYGAEHYYRLEEDAMRTLATFDNAVIATSATTVMGEKNAISLQEFCYLVLLYAEPETAVRRLEEDETAPLKNNILKRRKEYFNNISANIKPLADIVIDISKASAHAAAEKVLIKLEELFEE